jgi:hypothetical protein
MFITLHRKTLKATLPNMAAATVVLMITTNMARQ